MPAPEGDRLTRMFLGRSRRDAVIFEDCPGDGDPLLLSAGEPVAALADDGVIAVGQRASELVQVGGLRRGGQVGVGGVWPGIAEVVSEAGVEQEGVLEYHADLSAD